MIVIATCAPGCCETTLCDFLRSGGMNHLYGRVFIPAGLLLDNDTCGGCSSVNGKNWTLCCPIIKWGDPEEGTQTGWNSSWVFDHITCGPGVSGTYRFQLNAWVFCANGEVTVRVSVGQRATPVWPGSGGCGPTGQWRVTFAKQMSEEEFEDFLGAPGTRLQLTLERDANWADTSDWFRCSLNPEVTDGLYFDLVEICNNSTTTTTTPEPWICAQQFPLAGSQGDCTIDYGCVQRTVINCLGDIDCQFCDGPFESEEACLESASCIPPTTTTTTTTTTPEPWWCCAEDLGFCGTANVCQQGPACPEGLPFECSGPYETSEECNAACVNTTTTTTPECDSTDANNPCTEFGCYMLCEGGTYTAPQNLLGPAICECNPSPEDIALIGQPCTGARITARCNSCNNAVTNQCPTTPEP